jgi:2-polyprenyl-3-methyl-5-hydroxy-6-metoxy-1,4-benzoquinol methylase
VSRPGDRGERLRESWTANADAWTDVVREGRIESRRAGTDAAVLDAVLALRPDRVLDVGCGEGWLCRALADRGVRAVGLDGSAELVGRAREAGREEYHHLPYERIEEAPERVGGGFDAMVCNFSLLDEALVPLLSALRALAAVDGTLVIQTAHPWTARGDAPYEDGWRTETFESFGNAFARPMPWYYRTLESWVAAVAAAGWSVDAIREPRHPETGMPLSLILVARPAAGES